MGTIGIFRALAITAPVLLFVTLISTWTAPAAPPAVASYLAGQNLSSLGGALAHGNLGMEILVGALIVGFVAAYVIALAGLFVFRRWARVLFVMLMPLGLALQAALGTTIHRPIDAFEAIGRMVDGALLVLLFVEPVRARFRTAVAPAQPPAPLPPGAP